MPKPNNVAYMFSAMAIVLSGCLTNSTTPSGIQLSLEPLPEFPYYVNDTISFTIKATNPTDSPQTETVCGKLDGAYLDCQTIALAPGQTKTVTFTGKATHPGTLPIEAGGLQATVTVAPMPKIGDLVTGPLVTIRLEDTESPYNVSKPFPWRAYNITFTVDFHNGTTPVSLEFFTGQWGYRLHHKEATQEWSVIAYERPWETNRPISISICQNLSQMAQTCSGNNPPNLYRWQV